MDSVYVNWKADCRALMAEWWTAPPLDSINCLIVHFYGAARGDLDNRLGAVMDAGNDLLWTDDNVNVIRSAAAKFEKRPPSQSRIYMKIIWDGGNP